MPKRFTATEKWLRPWFQDLEPPYQLFWLYLCDHCDHAGVWYPNFRHASWCLKSEIDGPAALAIFQKQVKLLDGKHWFIVDFIPFQYGKLNPFPASGRKSPLHLSIVRRLLEVGIDPTEYLLEPGVITRPEYVEMALGYANPIVTLSQGLGKGKPYPKLRPKVKDTVKAKAKAVILNIPANDTINRDTRPGSDLTGGVPGA